MDGPQPIDRSPLHLRLLSADIDVSPSSHIDEPAKVHDRQDTQRVPIEIETPHSLKDWVGREIAVTEWFLLSQDRIQSFADVSEDHQWIHLDRERAKRESPHHTTIAHGFLTLSLLSRFLKDAIRIRRGVRMSINYGLNRVRFPAPVYTDSRIRAHFTIQSVKELPDAVEAVFQVTIEGEGCDKPCCFAEWVIRYYP